jgi:hypothetical protein
MTASPPEVKGDQTLIGTRLQLISQLQNGSVQKMFQITSAVGLDMGQAQDLLEQVQGGDGDGAVSTLLSTQGIDERFHAVLTAASTTPFSQTNLLGKDGFPDLRFIFDFSPFVATATCQVHTILEFKTTDGPDALAAALPGGNATNILTLVNKHCKIVDSEHLAGMIAAALS